MATTDYEATSEYSTGSIDTQPGTCHHYLIDSDASILHAVANEAPAAACQPEGIRTDSGYTLRRPLVVVVRSHILIMLNSRSTLLDKSDT